MTTQLTTAGASIDAYEVLTGQHPHNTVPLVEHLLGKLSSEYLVKMMHVFVAADPSGTSVRVEYGDHTLFALTFEHAKTQAVYDKWSLYIYGVDQGTLNLTEANEYGEFRQAVTDLINQVTFAVIFDEVNDIAAEDPEFDEEDSNEISIRRDLMH